MHSANIWKQSPMNNFTISQLQQFSGIKAHTIRIWEQRYNALQPNRSVGNTRYYDNTQLRRLLNIVSLIGNQYKVSELCLMPDEKLFQLIHTQLKTFTKEDKSEEYYISQLISAGLSFDSNAFEKLFAAAVHRFDIRNTYIDIIYPMLVRLGLLWTADSLPPAQEHFISNFIRQKLFSAIDALPQKPKAKETWVLFLPENEFHELGLLFSNYLIKNSGGNVIYLGSSLPFDTLVNVVREIKPENVLFFLVQRDSPDTIKKYLITLAKSVRAKIYVGANGTLFKSATQPKQIHLLSSVEDLEKVLQH